MLTAIGLLLGGITGLFLGVFGGGGATIAVPVLVYGMHFGASEAIAMSLVVVGSTSVIGGARAWRAGVVHPRQTLLLGSVAMVGAYLGARAAAVVPDALQLAFFAVILIGSAVLMLRRMEGGRSGQEGDETSPATPEPRRPPPPLLIGLTGAAVGVMTGLAGVGGGFLVVPALILLGVPMSGAVGTSLVVIALNSAAGLVGYLPHVTLPWGLAAMITGAAMLGYFGGERIAVRMPERALRRAFAVFLLATGAFVLFQNRTVLTEVEHAVSARVQR